MINGVKFFNRIIGFVLNVYINASMFWKILNAIKINNAR
jgi:hypothetical protein